MYLKKTSSNIHTCYTIGADGIAEELQDAGFEVIGGTAFSKEMFAKQDSYVENLRLDPKVGAVITGNKCLFICSVAFFFLTFFVNNT